MIELEQQRDALEEELDTVRERACKLGNTVDSTKRELAEQQAQWSVELKQMRQVLQHQAELMSAGQTVAPSAETAVPASSLNEVVESEDRANRQVVGSVMAQFEKLRQQRAQRCAKRTQVKQHQEECV